MRKVGRERKGEPNRQTPVWPVSVQPEPPGLTATVSLLEFPFRLPGARVASSSILRVYHASKKYYRQDREGGRRGWPGEDVYIFILESRDP